MMRILLALTLSLTAAGWSSAFACSILPPPATTEINYEERVKPYLMNTHREMVDAAHHIVIGSFKYSKSKKSHQLKISEALKTDLAIKPNKSIPVTFESIANNRVTYRKRKKVDLYLNLDELLNTPSYRPFGIDGTYGPGDCGISLEIAKNTNYLIFANAEFEITSMSPISEKTQVLKNAIKTMIDNPQDKFGASLTLQQVLERGTKMKLLTTESCLPVPTYNTLSTSSVEDETKLFKAKPILVFETVQTKSVYRLSEEEREHARNLGLIWGHYTNAPNLSACMIGQKYLSLGEFLFLDSENDHGQMIPEQSGHFDLSETIFEHHITPSEISLDQILKLLEEHKLTEANPK